MSWIGGVSMAEMGGDRAAFPYQLTGVAPTAVTGGPTSGYGAQFNQAVGGNWHQLGWSLGASWEKAWWYFAWTGVGTPSADSFVFFYAQRTVTPGNGTVRVGMTHNGSGSFNFYVGYYNGTSWVNGAVGSARTHTNTHYCVLEINRAPASDVATLYVNGSSDCSVTYTGGGAMIAEPEPCIELLRESGKGTNSCVINVWEVFVNDDRGAAPTTLQSYNAPATADTYHCYANYPDGSVADVTSGWTRSGCATRGSLNVNDPQTSAAKGDNHNLVTGNGTNQDDVFEVTDQSGGTAAVEAVYVVALSTSSVPVNYTYPDSVLAAVPSESGTPTPYTGSTLTNANHGRYKFLPTTPSLGSAWTKSLFNEFRAGYRNSSASTAERVYCMVVGVIGKNLAVPGAASACPVAGFAYSQAIII